MIASSTPDLFVILLKSYSCNFQSKLNMSPPKNYATRLGDPKGIAFRDIQQHEPPNCIKRLLFHQKIKQTTQGNLKTV